MIILAARPAGAFDPLLEAIEAVEAPEAIPDPVGAVAPLKLEFCRKIRKLQKVVKNCQNAIS